MQLCADFLAEFAVASRSCTWMVKLSWHLFLEQILYWPVE